MTAGTVRKNAIYSNVKDTTNYGKVHKVLDDSNLIKYMQLVSNEEILFETNSQKIDEDLDINENEISLVKYIDTRDLLSKMENKNEYTPWFEMEWHTLLTSYQKTLRQYTTI